MHTKDTKIGNTAVLSVSGRIDASSAPGLQEQVTAMIDAMPEAENLIFDLTGIDYVSSAGLRVFLLAAKAMATRPGKLALAGANADVTNVIRLTGIDRLVRLCGTVDEAHDAVGTA